MTITEIDTTNDMSAPPGPIPAWVERITALPPRVRTALRWALLISLVVHVAAMPFILPRASDKLRREMEKSKNTYLAKMIQKERGKIRGNEIRSLVKPPPLPPDPQQYAKEAITRGATRGVTQVLKDLMTVTMKDEMVKHIETNLKDEIDAMAEKIKKGVKPDELKKMEGDLQERVFVMAHDWNDVHREDVQIEHASGSVTDWYENFVAKQFKTMIRQELFSDDRGQWRQVFANENAGFLRSSRSEWGPLPYENVLDSLDRILKNRFPGDIKDLPDEAKGQMKPVKDAGWAFDVPSPAHAAAVAYLLNGQYQAWSEACADYFQRFYPHRLEEMQREKAALDAQWKQLLAAAETYRRQAVRETGAAESGKACQAVLDLGKSLKEHGEKLALRWRNPKEAECNAVNQALRSRLLRGPFLDEVHRYLVERIVEKIRPAVVSLAKNQFREGMVYSKDEVQKAIEEFGVSSASLLRRDIEEALTKPLLQRALFLVRANPYLGALSGKSAPPAEEDVARDERALEQTVAKWPDADKAYVGKRAEAIQAEIKASVDRTVAGLLTRMVDKDGILARSFYATATTVDWTDKIQVKLELRNLALKGRGQDMADITEDGVPDPANPKVALLTAVEAGQVAVQPVLTALHPDFYATAGRSAQALRMTQAFYGTAPPAPMGFVTQVKVVPPFVSPAFEAIPYLPTPPRLDGDLSHWGSVRPLLLGVIRDAPDYLGAEPLKLYAGWNYQGFFFAYHVSQPAKFFCRTSQYVRGADGVSWVKRSGDLAHTAGWVFEGENLCLRFDTLDSRYFCRGDPNMQEFYVLPAGTDNDPTTPGGELIVASRRDGETGIGVGNWPQRPCSLKVFPPQPAEGPDGSGPYRVMKPDGDGNGYAVEVFLPRTMFNVPVFAPGWHVGFDCVVGVGSRGNRESVPGYQLTGASPNYHGQWEPSFWGDLLLLGTDAEIRLQDAEPGWPRAEAVVPGHSYLVTVVDPDHNVNPAAVDSVLVSTEAIGDRGHVDDVEVFVLKESGANTGLFRGIVNTQPGSGGQAHGIAEILPGKELRFAYEDFADSNGRRNVVHEIKLPVVSSLMNLAEGKEVISH